MSIELNIHNKENMEPASPRSPRSVLDMHIEQGNASFSSLSSKKQKQQQQQQHVPSPLGGRRRLLVRSKSGSRRRLVKTDSVRRDSSSKSSREGSVSPQKQQKKKKVKKVLRFQEWVTCHQSTDEPITKDEKAAAFYTNRDFAMFEKQERILVRSWRRLQRNSGGNEEESRRSKELLKSDNYNVRGLENVLTVRESIACRERYMDVLQAVMQEQEYQRMTGTYLEPIALRKVSLMASKTSKLIARNLAERDADAVEEMYGPRNRLETRSSRREQLKKESSNRKMALLTKKTSNRMDRQLIRKQGSARNVDADSKKVGKQLRTICLFQD